MTVLLDTSVLIDVLRDRCGRRALLARLIREGHSLGCCPINIAEVYSGMRPKEAEATERFLGSLDYIPISREAARLAGSLQSEWKAKGQTLFLADTLVAAVALSEGLTLATDNVRHFPMKDLHLLPLSE